MLYVRHGMARYCTGTVLYCTNLFTGRYFLFCCSFLYDSVGYGTVQYGAIICSKNVSPFCDMYVRLVEYDCAKLD